MRTTSASVALPISLATRFCSSERFTVSRSVRRTANSSSSESLASEGSAAGRPARKTLSALLPGTCRQASSLVNEIIGDKSRQRSRATRCNTVWAARRSGQFLPEQ